MPASQIRAAAVEALALLQNVTTEDVDVVEVLESNGVHREHLSAVMTRLHNTAVALPRINQLGILELSYEHALGSQTEGDPTAPSPLVSPPLETPVDGSRGGSFSAFWSEEPDSVHSVTRSRVSRFVGAGGCGCSCHLTFLPAARARTHTPASRLRSPSRRDQSRS